MRRQPQRKRLLVFKPRSKQHPISPAARGISRLQRIALSHLFALIPLGFLLATQIASADSYCVPYYYPLVNQLNASPDNRVDHVFPAGTLPDYSTLGVYDCSLQGFKYYISDSASPSLWDDENYSPLPASDLPVLTPGVTGFILLPSAPISLCFYGTLPSPGPITLPCGLDTYSLVGRPDYVSGNSTYEDILGTPVNGTHVKKWNFGSQTYDIYIYACGSWMDAQCRPLATAPVFAPGEAAFILVPDVPWPGMTPPLSVTSAGGQTITVTWSDWILEEAGAVSGPWTNAPVQLSPWSFTPAVTQKFYRLRAP
jgi:hypothetical protein